MTHGKPASEWEVSIRKTYIIHPTVSWGKTTKIKGHDPGMLTVNINSKDGPG